ncbi:hypothetical protein AVEN_53763-1, partial [Araneus ventricosus]
EKSNACRNSVPKGFHLHHTLCSGEVPCGLDDKIQSIPEQWTHQVRRHELTSDDFMHSVHWQANEGSIKGSGVTSSGSGQGLATLCDNKMKLQHI